MRRIKKEELCPKCRKVRPNGSDTMTMDDWFDSEGYNKKGLEYAMMMNQAALVYLRDDGDNCPICIPLVKSAINS